MPLAPSDSVLTWMEPGSEVTGSHTSSYPSALYSGRNYSPYSGSSAHLGSSPGWTAHQASLRQPAHSPAWTNQSSKHPGIMDLLRTLFFIAARNNVTVSLVHLPGSLNCIADALSRNQMSRFFSLAPQPNHPTRSDVTWVKEGLHFLIKKLKTNQAGRGTIISMCNTHHATCPVMAL